MTDNIQEQIEDKVIDCINSGVAGRLIVFKPEKSILGADLAVERRGGYKEKELYFQINSIVGPAKEKSFIKDFLQESFKTDKNFYLIFVYFNEVLQKMDDYLWLIPSLQFRDIAEVVQPADGKNLLRFDASLDIKDKNKYSKFIVNTKDFGKLILGAVDKGGKFDFKGAQADEGGVLNLESLKEFLCEARENTYAANGSGIDNPRLLESTQLEFQKGDYSYRDIYFPGVKNVIGQEIVYLGLKPVWGMNYMGNAIGRTETNFLKEAIFKLSKKCRLGGVCEYEKRELKYQDRGQGGFDKFFGEEGIFSQGKDIYKLSYQGGII